MADFLIKREVPGLSALIHEVVTGGPDGNETHVVVYEDGRPSAADFDKAAEPDVTLTLPLEDAQRIADGDLDLAVPYMQGRLKAEGNMTTLFALLAPERH